MVTLSRKTNSPLRDLEAYHHLCIIICLKIVISAWTEMMMPIWLTTKIFHLLSNIMVIQLVTNKLVIKSMWISLNLKDHKIKKIQTCGILQLHQWEKLQFPQITVKINGVVQQRRNSTCKSQVKVQSNNLNLTQAMVQVWRLISRRLELQFNRSLNQVIRETMISHGWYPRKRNLKLSLNSVILME